MFSNQVLLSKLCLYDSHATPSHENITFDIQIFSFQVSFPLSFSFQLEGLQSLSCSNHTLMFSSLISPSPHVCPSIYSSQEPSVITFRSLLSHVLFSSSVVTTLSQAPKSLTIAIKSVLKALLLLLSCLNLFSTE